jgi:peptidoglycan/LPS O-acetylase OafA/YrhL
VAWSGRVQRGRNRTYIAFMVAAGSAELIRAPGNDFRPDIQGLRALAIVLVLVTHAGLPVLRGGFVGVDVFFVISGFVITRVLVAELRSTGRLSVARFYQRRV